ncbi:IS21 family transposase [Streptosporangium sp. NPDC002721]|uniref:IS21 family transposase n=1 Tax=Streptosporangium sp. NPDC002721 TaxID=3366188 RepID=UPI00368DBD37
MSRVEQFAAIRRDSRLGGLSVRALAKKYGVHRRTVREALSSAWPAQRKKPARRSSRLDRFKPVIDEMLRADLDAPRKQRHTVRRIFNRLVAEHEMEAVSYSTVCNYVGERRPQILAEAGRIVLPEVPIDQVHRPGVEAEVDFGEVWVDLGGVMTSCFLFVFRLSYSGKAVHRITATAGQEAFFEGHAHAFRVLGGIPTGKVRYDNLRAAVAQVVGLSRARVENERWVAFRSHYGLDVFYCRPGKDGAHEKGGVEGEVGRFRRNHLVPVPQVASLAELNAMIEDWEAEDDHRRIGARARTISEDFATEQPLLQPLPEEPFETGRVFHPRVDRRAQICVRMNHYSVPVRLIGRQVRVLLHASELVVFDGRTEVARHERMGTRHQSRLDLDHYLEILMRKPGALPGSTALEQARQTGKFTPVHDAWWAAVRRAHGDADGTRALIEVLLLHRTMAHDHVVAGIAMALSVGALSADVVAVEARKAAQADQVGSAEPQHTTPGSRPVGNPAEIPDDVASLTQRRLTTLPVDSRPLPSVAAYDQLLRRRDRPSAASQGDAS